MENKRKPYKKRTPPDSYILPEKVAREKAIKIALTPEEYIAIHEIAKDWEVLPPVVFRQCFSLVMQLSDIYIGIEPHIPSLLKKAYPDKEINQELLANIKYKAFALQRLKKYWKR